MSHHEQCGGRLQLPPHVENYSEQRGLQALSYHSASDRSNQAAKSSDDIAVRYRSGGQSYIVGKVIRLGSRRVFFSRVKDGDLLRTLDAWSIAPEVVDLLERLGVEQVEYFYDRANTLYSVDTDTIKKCGILKAMHATIGRRYHLARKHWQVTRLTYSVPYVEVEIEVVADPLPRQASLFEEVVG